jgi:D-ribose pyranase
MKKIGTLNSHLSRLIAVMGHTDRVVICDSGLPIPRRAEVVDLALTENIPRFLDTVRVILKELQVERAIIAKEMRAKNPSTHGALIRMLKGIPIRSVSHNEFKKITGRKGNITFVKTGEATPYANVIFVAGVTFS